MQASRVRHSENFYQTADGLRLFERCWEPDGLSKGLIYIIHGLAEHGGRYDKAIGHLTEAGYAVSLTDLRGHGRSDGPRAFVSSFSLYLQDLENSLFRIRQRERRKRIFLLGHSMGGLIAALYTTERTPDIGGLILSGPVAEPGAGVSLLAVVAAKALSRFLPRLPLQRIETAAISRDPEVVKSYVDDPLVHHGGISAKMGGEMLSAMERLRRGMACIQMPLLILHGGADRIVSVEGSRNLCEAVGSKDKKLIVYENLYHEIMNEPEHRQVLDDIVNWLNDRTNSACSGGSRRL